MGNNIRLLQGRKREREREGSIHPRVSAHTYTLKCTYLYATI